MAETPEGTQKTDLTRRAVLTGSTGLALGAVSAAVTAGTAAAEPNLDDAAVTKTAEQVVATQDPFMLRKQLWTFDVLDTNHDGVVTPYDTMTFAHRLARLTGHAEDSPRAQQAVATVDRIMQEFIATPDWVPDPKRLHREEFVLVVANSLVELSDKTLQYIGIVTNLAFSMADGDNDGRVNRHDGIRLFTRVLRVERERSKHAWEVLDSEGRGWLDYADLLMAVTDFVTSADPLAPGNLALDI